MMEIKDERSICSVKELRKLMLDDIALANFDFHALDLKRLQNDHWLQNFLIFNDYNVNAAKDQIINTLKWRKQVGVNDLTEELIKKEDLINGNIYIRGRDIDGKCVMYFRIRLYNRGSRTLDDLQNFFLYWVERGLRHSLGDQMTLVLDMQGAGVKNMDLEYTKMMVSIFKNYYPNSMNYMLVYDMPWICSGIFQIIKGLLPKKVLDRMKFINSKNAMNYISESNQPKEWGGTDNYELKFEPEEFDGKLVNNNIECVNLEKVHFANFQEASPMSETSYENNYGDMLTINPAETLMFHKNPISNEYAGNVEIVNVSKKTISYKIKTTAPDKFRVRPSSGTLSSNNKTTINVVICQKGQNILPITKDKFLIMCMQIPGESLSSDEINNLWKEVNLTTSPDIEQHRLKCSMTVNSNTIMNNDVIEDYYFDNNTQVSTAQHHSLTSTQPMHNGTKQQMLQNHLADSIVSMQKEIKSLQSLICWLGLILIVLGIAIVYILKMEIQNQNSQYCIDK